MRVEQGLAGALNTCIESCYSCLLSCLRDKQADIFSRCIRLCRDCGDICKLTVLLLSRESPFTEDLLLACAQSCEACAQECRRNSAEFCGRCAQVTSVCAEMCRTTCTPEKNDGFVLESSGI